MPSLSVRHRNTLFFDNMNFFRKDSYPMSAFSLKMIAAAAMLIDHIGVIFFPEYKILRIIGRISFPLFAYFIAEGFHYTKNRLKYFARIFVLGLICQAVYFAAEREMFFGALITFSFSIAIMSCTEQIKARTNRTAAIAVTAAVILCIYIFTENFDVDYGFFGVLLPVLINIVAERKEKAVMMSIGLCAICMSFGNWVQPWSFLAVPLVLLYNGSRGKYKMKYFFYVFYPLHLAVLYGISMLLNC